tara:strand:+ start:287 stop:412 length:126 start_codon:yes stop_codon:yes gene_type:complete
MILKYFLETQFGNGDSNNISAFIQDWTTRIARQQSSINLNL